ncbi:glycosyltransferase [Vibrio breoganii]
MKLNYITTVNIDEESAQAIQITSMFKEFEKKLDLDFRSICMAKDNFSTDNRVRIRTRENKKLNTILLYFLCLKMKVFASNVFTRDILIAAFCLLLGNQVIWECHQKTRRINNLLLKVLNLSKRFSVLAISEAIKEDVFLPVDKEKIFVYHDCIDAELLNDAYVDKLDDKVALYTGALHKGKDFDSLICLFNAYPSWRFYIVGGKHCEIEKYKDILSELDIKNVKFFGRLPHSDVLKMQREASVLLYPLTESNPLWKYTSPLKLFEYMASYRPIVASRIGSVNEIVSEELAYTYTDNICNAFSKFLGDEKSQHTLKSKKCIELLENKFTWGRRVDFICNQIFKLNKL